MSFSSQSNNHASMAAASEVNGRTDDDSSIWRDEGVGPQEVDHLPSRVSGGRGVIAESHAEQRAVGKRHVECVRSVWIDDELQVGRGLRLSALHLPAETSR